MKSSSLRIRNDSVQVKQALSMKRGDGGNLGGLRAINTTEQMTSWISDSRKKGDRKNKKIVGKEREKLNEGCGNNNI